MKLFDILITRHNAFNILRTSLAETNQTGVLQILQEKSNMIRVTKHLYYDKTKEIGNGGFGKVYSGEYKDLKVAVKVMANFNVVSSKLEAECNYLKRLTSHQNIVQCMYAKKIEHFTYIVMELCRFDLEVGVKKNKIDMLPACVCEQCITGLDFLHGKKIAHRDIKPKNILINSDNNIKLADFGISKDFTKTEVAIGSQTKRQISLSWSAPEILYSHSHSEPQLRIDFEPDIFSLGCVFFFVHTHGLHPFGEDEIKQPVKIMEGSHELSNNCLQIEWRDLIKRMISHAPDNRPDTKAVINDIVFKNPDPVRHAHPTCERTVLDTSNSEIDNNKVIDIGCENIECDAPTLPHSQENHLNTLIVGIDAEKIRDIVPFNVEFRNDPPYNQEKKIEIGMLELRDSSRDTHTVTFSNAEKGVKIRNGTRCPDKAYIVFLGMTGSGKTLTMDMLIDPVDASKGDIKQFTSDTEEIIEYEVCDTGPEGKPNQLMLIDTPGFKTCLWEDYIDGDQRILFTAQNYIKEHSDLKTAFPNAVLLVFDFCSRSIGMEMENAYEYMFLQYMELMIKNNLLIDVGSDTCNLILVLTHFMHACECDTENTASTIRKFLGVLKTFTTIPSSITVVLAENKGADFGLDNCDGSFRLPTGDLYPQNLISALERVAKKANDHMGASIITTAFRDSRMQKKKIFNKVPIVNPDNPGYLKFMHELKLPVSDTYETEITETLQNLWNNLPRQETFGDGLAIRIAKSVFIREKIDNRLSLPITTDKVLALFRQLPEKKSIFKILRQVGIHLPSLNVVKESAGCFYKVISDKVDKRMPFAIVSKKITQSGYKAPTFLQVYPITTINRILIKVDFYETREEYVSNRLDSIGVVFDADKESNFVAPTLPGNNIRLNNPGKVTGIKEFREYSINLTKDFELLPSYVDEIKGKTCYYSSQNMFWSHHFSVYGCHVLKSGFLGGSIVLTANQINGLKEYARLSDIYFYIETILAHLGESIVESVPRTPQGWNFKLEFYGGCIYNNEIELEEALSSEGHRRILNWIESLKFEPTVLFSEIQIEHVSEYIKKFYQREAEVVSDAANAIYGFRKFFDNQKSGENSKVEKTCILT